MNIVTTITNDPRQSFQVALDTGDTIYFNLYFFQTQNNWYYDFTYNDYTCNGSRVALSPNSIRHLRNILPFGIAFLSDGNVEPFNLDDFKSGRVQMAILDSAEVQEVEELIYS